MSRTFQHFTMAAVLLAMTVCVKPAKATIALEVFDFTGTCGDCVGTGNGTLAVIAGYTPGSPLAGSFYSFTYSSSIITTPFTIGQNSPGLSVSGSLPSVLPGAANISISDNAWSFNLSSNGTWSVLNTEPADQGTNGSFSIASASTPEPSSWVLFGAGLLALAAFARPRAIRLRN